MSAGCEADSQLSSAFADLVIDSLPVEVPVPLPPAFTEVNPPPPPPPASSLASEASQEPTAGQLAKHIQILQQELDTLRKVQRCGLSCPLTTLPVFNRPCKYNMCIPSFSTSSVVRCSKQPHCHVMFAMFSRGKCCFETSVLLLESPCCSSAAVHGLAVHLIVSPLVAALSQSSVLFSEAVVQLKEGEIDRKAKEMEISELKDDLRRADEREQVLIAKLRSNWSEAPRDEKPVKVDDSAEIKLWKDRSGRHHPRASRSEQCYYYVIPARVSVPFRASRPALHKLVLRCSSPITRSLVDPPSGAYNCKKS